MAESDEHSVTTCLENGDFAPLLYRVTMDRSVFLLNDPTPQTHNPMVVSIILCQCNFFFDIHHTLYRYAKKNNTGKRQVHYYLIYFTFCLTNWFHVPFGSCSHTFSPNHVLS
jgi:hypothetical protein